MNTRRNASRDIGVAAAGVNKVPPKALPAGMDMPVNATALIDGEVRNALVQISQAITLQAQAMKAQA